MMTFLLNVIQCKPLDGVYGNLNQFGLQGTRERLFEDFALDGFVYFHRGDVCPILLSGFVSVPVLMSKYKTAIILC